MAVGARVAINPIIACGFCDSCVRGDENLCRRAGLLGREMPGSLAEHVLLPERYLHPLPAHVPLDAATLIETLATVRHAQRRVRIDPGDAVVVLGQGTTGLFHTRLAKLSGARPVVAVSRTATKRRLAERMGADATLDSTRADVVAEVLALTGGRGADLVIETSGDPRLVHPAIEMLRPGGMLVTCTCSYHVSQTSFLEMLRAASLDAHRTLRLIEIRGQAKDHPVLLNIPETAYLKCVILDVST